MPDLTKVKADLAAAGIPARYQEKGVFAVVSTYEASSTAADTVIEMCKVQAGVTVIGGQVIYDALGSSTTVAVGDSTATTFTAAFLAATSSASAGATALMTGGKFPKTYTVDDTIDIQVAGATASGTITLVVLMTAEEVDLA